MLRYATMGVTHLRPTTGKSRDSQNPNGSTRKGTGLGKQNSRLEARDCKASEKGNTCKNNSATNGCGGWVAVCNGQWTMKVKVKP